MALTNAQLDHISTLANVAKKFKETYTELVLLNDQWNGVPNFDADITQEEIDAVPSLVNINLTVGDLTEVNYIVSNLLPLVTGRITQVVKLSKL